MEIRRATESDMDGIMTLVCDIFDIEQGIPRSMNYIGEERSPRWWCIDNEGKIVGAIASYVEDGKTHLGRFAIKAEYRGGGNGTRLLRYAIEDLFNQGVDKIYTESRPATVRILEKMGGKVSGGTFPFFEGVCTPIDICKEDYIGN